MRERDRNQASSSVLLTYSPIQASCCLVLAHHVLHDAASQVAPCLQVEDYSPATTTLIYRLLLCKAEHGLAQGLKRRERGSRNLHLSAWLPQ